MERWGRWIARHAGRVVIAGVVVVVAMAAFGIGVFSALSNGGFDDAHSESARSLRAEQRLFGNHDSDVFVIYSSPSATVTDPQFRTAVQTVIARLDDPAVVRVTDWYRTQAPNLVSADRHATAVSITLAGTTQNEFTDSFAAIKDKLAAGAGLRTDIGGQWAVFDDVNTQVSGDIARAESISTPLVLLLSLLIFGSLIAALMPVMVGAIAVVGAFAVVRLITGVADVSIFAINVITLIGMGLAIDYALFVVSRFREEFARQPGTTRDDARRAVAATMATAGRTVLVSGVTVAAALASLLIFPQIFLRSMGYGGIAAVLVAMIAALTVLPAVLVLLGSRLNSLALPWQRRHVPEPGGSARWARIAHAVMRRPVAYLVGLALILLALGSPLLGVKWGSVDYRVLPDSAPSRVAIEKQITDFGGETSTATVVVENADASDTDAYAKRLQSVPGVRVQTVARNDNATLLQATWSGNSQTQSSQDRLRSLRAVEAPAGATVLIGGDSAEAVDLIHSVGRHLPWMALTVVLVMFVLLFLAFGSFVLPIKAVIMNALSISASFGVVTWIFADGHLASWLGFTSTGFLDATQPILMLAVLFGLSMDYEVFLLSRVREQWDATHDNAESVAVGVQRTGRIITSAALLLAVVIGAFATSGIVFIKMIGFGMLVAVLLDATVVRMLLVPATMRLLGNANWWAPGPLRRWYERYGLHESDAPRPLVRTG